MNDLVNTWLALPGVDPVALEPYGVGFRQSQIVGGVRQGKQGWILPCYIDPPSIYRTVDEPALIDLVVFDPARPSRFRTVTGNGIYLGEAAFDEARWYRLPLPIFRNPMTWLQSGGAGVCPLDAQAFARSMIGRDVRLVAEDVEHGEQLERIICSAARIVLPEIRVAA